MNFRNQKLDLPRRCSRSSSLAALSKLALVAAIVFSATGCTEPPEFRLNTVHKLALEHEHLDGEPISDAQIKQVGTVVTALFGTPQEPYFPKAGEGLVSIENLQLAAGPVASRRDGSPQGLYREHCAHCHGITGDGAGPTASFLNPYPRDFRLGKFKFKSTELFKPPTDEDIKRTLHRGISGTAMPSFALLPDEELDALVDYVKYLSIRGQVERALLEVAVAELDKGEALISPTTADVSEEDREYENELILESVEPIMKKWRTAEKHVIAVPALPAQMDSDVRDSMSVPGQVLFFGKASCVQCHGQTGVGDGQTENYDDWTNEWLARANISPDNKVQLKPFLDAGALKPRKLRPRNLRHRVFRGGSLPQDLFRRIRGGIEGTSMPANISLSDAEIWHLVAYILELPYSDFVDESREE